MQSICAALGIPVSALFSDARLTPAERRGAAEAKAIRDEHERRQRAIDRQRRDRIYKLEQVMHGIAARLIRRPYDDKLAELFHQVCDRLHEAELALSPVPEDGPMRLPEPSAVPTTVHDALVELGQNFNAKETVRCERTA